MSPYSLSPSSPKIESFEGFCWLVGCSYSENVWLKEFISGLFLHFRLEVSPLADLFDLHKDHICLSILSICDHRYIRGFPSGSDEKNLLNPRPFHGSTPKLLILLTPTVAPLQHGPKGNVWSISCFQPPHSLTSLFFPCTDLIPLVLALVNRTVSILCPMYTE